MYNPTNFEMGGATSAAEDADLTNEQIDQLSEYYRTNFGGFTDDVDIANDHADEWISSLDQGQIKQILETPSQRLTRLAGELVEGLSPFKNRAEEDVEVEAVKNATL